MASRVLGKGSDGNVWVELEDGSVEKWTTASGATLPSGLRDETMTAQLPGVKETFRDLSLIHI